MSVRRVASLVGACLVAWCGAACLLASRAAMADDIVTSPSVGYHGFRIEPASLAASLDVDHPALARQIAIVEAVGVPSDVLTFFRSVPIRVVRDLPRPPGEFVDGPRGGFVRIEPDGMAADRPILLHELLHAYHAAVVGLDNADIDAAYAAGKRSADHPARDRRAHYLENAREYFAVTATIFLFGPIRQPPFDCAVLEATEPDYLAFLATRFGPHDCR